MRLYKMFAATETQSLQIPAKRKFAMPRFSDIWPNVVRKVRVTINVQFVTVKLFLGIVSVYCPTRDVVTFLRTLKTLPKKNLLNKYYDHSIRNAVKIEGVFFFKIKKRLLR